MQDRYAGDIGDFEKFGLLRHLVKVTRWSLGIVWYKIPCETHNNDGHNRATEIIPKEDDMEIEYRSGTSKTTQIGYINKHQQKVHGSKGVKGNDHGQSSYKVECLRTLNSPPCGYVYGANGSDLFQRKCPKCQNGRLGIPF